MRWDGNVQTMTQRRSSKKEPLNSHKREEQIKKNQDQHGETMSDLGDLEKALQMKADNR